MIGKQCGSQWKIFWFSIKWRDNNRSTRRFYWQYCWGKTKTKQLLNNEHLSCTQILFMYSFSFFLVDFLSHLFVIIVVSCFCCFFFLLVSIWNKFSWKIDCLAVIYKMFRRILWTLFHQFSKSFAIFLYIKLLNVKMIHFSTKWWKFINFTWKQFSVLFFKKIFLYCNNSAYFGIQLLEPLEIWIKFPAAGNETNVMNTEIWRLLKLRIQNSWPKIDAYKFNMNKIKAQYSEFISSFKICLGVFVNIKKFIAVYFFCFEWMAKKLEWQKHWKNHLTTVEALLVYRYFVEQTYRFAIQRAPICDWKSIESKLQLANLLRHR